MKHIKNLATWFVDDMIICDDDYDTWEMEMMDMYMNWLDMEEINGKKPGMAEESLVASS